MTKRKDDLEMDKDLRFDLMLEHGSNWDKYYFQEVYKDQSTLLKRILDSIRHKKENRK